MSFRSDPNKASPQCQISLILKLCFSLSLNSHYPLVTFLLFLSPCISSACPPAGVLSFVPPVSFCHQHCSCYCSVPRGQLLTLRLTLWSTLFSKASDLQDQPGGCVQAQKTQQFEQFIYLLFVSLFHGSSFIYWMAYFFSQFPQRNWETSVAHSSPFSCSISSVTSEMLAMSP